MSKIDDIIDLLKQYDQEYHSEGESSITDREYDALRRKAQSMDPGNPYFTLVGSDVRGGKIKLPFTMGSLDQTHLGGEINDWVAKYNVADEDIVVTDKYDGISVMCIYRDGLLEIAYSRGNGIEGADITRHVKHIPSVPKRIPHKGYLCVRAELEMEEDLFQRTYRGTGPGQYKTARAMVAGSCNRSTTDQSILDNITMIAYQVVSYGDLLYFGQRELTSKVEELEFLRSEGFKIAEYSIFRGKELTDEFLTKYVLQRKQNNPFELDGVVATINKYEAQSSQRKSTTTLNPEHSIKYKIVDEDAVVEARVKRVLWEISKSGFYKPRVEIYPVELYGTTVTYATGFNGKFIRDKGIGPGARIKITKSGSVIPYIMEVLEAVMPQFPTDDFIWNENDVEITVVDGDHPEVKFKQILSFATTLQVELLKESNLQEAFDRMRPADLPYDEIIITLFDLTEQEWVKLVGANGSKIWSSLHRRAANMTLETFLGAVKFLGFGFGVRKAKALLAQVDSTDDLLKYDVNYFANLDGFDTTTATKVVDGLPEAMKLLNQLVADGYITLVTQVKTAEMKGLNVVFTGFRDAELEETIEKAGGKIGSSVSSKTTHLLTMDPKSTSGKAKKARDLGVTVMSPDEFKDTFNL